MNRIHLRPIISLALFLAAIAAFAQSPSGLVFSPAQWDYGSLAQGERAFLTLVVSNPGTRPVTVTFIPTCSCLTVDPATRIIAADGRAAFSLTYDSTDDSGITWRGYIVRSDAPGARDGQYLLHGVVRQHRTASAWSTDAAPASRADQSIEGIPVTYYYTPGCRSCEEFLSVEIPRIEKELSVKIALSKKDVLDPAAYEELSRFADAVGSTVKAIPALRVGNTLLQGDTVIRANLRGSLMALAQKNGHEAGGPSTTGSAGIFPLTSRLSIVPVFLAGLVDGINPCAFTTLIFLLASLALAGRGRREVLVIGAVFSFAVFLTYFLVGLGFFAALRAASAVAIVSIILRWVLVAVLVVFAGLSVYDYILIRKGRATDMLLQLPNALKKRIHASIRTRARTAALVGSSLVLGFLVSIFEFACTGQVYLPTLAYLARVQKGLNAIGLLLLYNLIFIAPLLVVFGMTYAGVGSARITKVFQKHMGAVKLALAAVFVGLAVFTLVG
jgi:cytochrome c biogenesis protein CcdA